MLNLYNSMGVYKLYVKYINIMMFHGRYLEVVDMHSKVILSACAIFFTFNILNRVPRVSIVVLLSCYH